MNLTFIPRREFLCQLLDGSRTFKAGSNLCSSLLHKMIRQSPCFPIYTDPAVCDSTTMTGTELKGLARFFCDIFCTLVMIQSWRPQLWRIFTSTQTNTPPRNTSLLKLCKVRTKWDGEISNHTYSIIPLFILLNQITLQHIQT